MVECVRRVQDGLGSEGQLQQIQRLPRQLVRDSSSLPVVSDRRIHIVLKDLKLSNDSSQTTDKISDVSKKGAVSCVTIFRNRGRRSMRKMAYQNRACF